MVAPAVVLAEKCAYGTCQTGCAALVVTCYTVAGGIFGVTSGVAATTAVKECDVAFGKCQASCSRARSAPRC
ncbi:hypothetical protein GQ607_016441 [Colletotrichum asianum]|uniref:Uncharacterized protein n=1 Tax=Colletotrichum asianum TaxID=702518 RepID=A0A8H3VZG2_9PEZI|nr:hypothetical protein GQ607_016441 [Colletotrichum asianum]